MICRVKQTTRNNSHSLFTHDRARSGVGKKKKCMCARSKIRAKESWKENSMCSENFAWNESYFPCGLEYCVFIMLWKKIWMYYWNSNAPHAFVLFTSNAFVKLWNYCLFVFACNHYLIVFLTFFNMEFCSFCIFFEWKHFFAEKFW